MVDETSGGTSRWDEVGRSRYERRWNASEARAARDRWRQSNGGEDEFGWKCAMLLLGQEHWIRRRVESVSFTDIGTTRRRLSFDFTLSEDKRLHWRDETGSQDMVAVPLTFLGKGDLVHLDARTQSGESVTIMDKINGQEVLLAAARYCFRQIPDFDSLMRTMDDRWGRRRKDSDWTCLDSAIDACIRDKSDDAHAARKRQRMILQLLRLMRCDVNLRRNWLDDGFQLQLHDWSNSRRGQSKGDSAFEALMASLEGYVGERIEALPCLEEDIYGRQNVLRAAGWMMPVEAFLLLLSTCIDCYVSIALVSEEYVKHRCMLKMSFDSDYSENELDRYLHPNFERLNFAFQASSAYSTHVELDPIAGGSIGKVEWDVRGAWQNDVEMSIVSGRLHFATNPVKHVPLMKIRVTLISQLPAILANVGWSLMFLACTLLNVLHAESMFGWAETYYNANNVLALLAVLFTLWVARRINSMSHSVSQELSRYPNVVVSANLAVTTVSYLLCGIDDGKVVPLGMVPRALAWMCLVVSAVLSLVSLGGLATWIRLKFGFRGNDGRWFSCLTDSGRFPLLQINAPERGDWRKRRVRPWNDKKQRAKEILASRKKTWEAMRSDGNPDTEGDRRDAGRGLRKKSPAFFLRLRQVLGSNAGDVVLPSEQGPYSLVSDWRCKADVLDDKRFFVECLWNPRVVDACPADDSQC